MKDIFHSVLVAMFSIVVITGCVATPTKPPGFDAWLVDYNEEYADALWMAWKEKEQKPEAQRLQEMIEPLSEQITTLETRVESLAGMSAEFEDFFAPTMLDLRNPRENDSSKIEGLVKEVLDGEEKRKTLGTALRDEILTAKNDLVEKINAATVRLVKAEESIKQTDEEDLSGQVSAVIDSVNELRAKHSKLLKDQGTTVESISKLTEDWPGTGRISAMERLQPYLAPGLIGIVAALLANLGLALRPRYRSQVEDAVRRADAAETAARNAQIAASTAKETADAIATRPKKRKSPASVP